MTIFAGLNPNQPVLDENMRLTQQARGWANSVTEMAVFVGSGSPEGVVSAVVGRIYIDTAGASGSVIYAKKLASIGGDDSQGWSL